MAKNEITIDFLDAIRKRNEQLLQDKDPVSFFSARTKTPIRKDLQKITTGADFKFGPKKRQIYLETLAQTGESAVAWVRAGVNKQIVDNTKYKDPEFAAQVEEAMDQYRAWLSGEIERRGFFGVEKPIYLNGAIVGWVVEFSDKLAELHAKRHIPEYRDKVTVTNENTGADSLLPDISKLPRALREKMRLLLEEIKEVSETKQVETDQEEG